MSDPRIVKADNGSVIEVYAKEGSVDIYTTDPPDDGVTNDVTAATLTVAEALALINALFLGIREAKAQADAK